MPAYTSMTDRFQPLSDSRSALHVTYLLPEVLFIVYASILSNYTVELGIDLVESGGKIIH